jgi:lactate permease
VSADVVFIVFGAILFLKFLERDGTLRSIEHHVQRLSPDRRIQAVFIAWLFGAFIEGSAGFGTPSIIVAPLLVSLGFPLLRAAAVALVANSTSVTFGAVGTPIKIGLPDFDAGAIAAQAAEINLLTGLSVPLMIVGLTVLSGPREGALRAFCKSLPWALWAGLAFTVPAYFFSALGPEFPTLLGSAVGMLLVGASLRWRFLVPKEVFSFQAIETTRGLEFKSHTLLRALAPYALLVLLLILGKMALASAHLSATLPDGSLLHWKPFNPGFAFLASVILLQIASRKRVSELRDLVAHAGRSVARPALSILAVVAFVQVLLSTERLGQALTQEASLPGMLSTLLSALPAASMVPTFSAAMGAFGAFVAGSATVSNLLFGPLQLALATSAQVDPVLAGSLQLVGAAMGNMVSLTNVVTVAAAVQATGKDVQILKQVAMPFVLYLILVTAYASLGMF